MTPFESAVEGSLEGSRGGRTHVHNQDHVGDRATPLSGTQLAQVFGRPIDEQGVFMSSTFSRRACVGIFGGAGLLAISAVPASGSSAAEDLGAKAVFTSVANPTDDVVAESMRIRGELGLDGTRSAVERALASEGVSRTASDTVLADEVNQYGFIGTAAEEAEITQREKLVQAVENGIPTLTSEEGFAGHYLDVKNGGSFVIQFKNGMVPDTLRARLDQVAEAAGSSKDSIEVREVANSSAELTSAMKSWWSSSSSKLVKSIGEDPARNGLVIDVETTDDANRLAAERNSATARSSLSAIDTRFRVTRSMGDLACTARNGCNDPQRGGVGITRWDSACSTGWVMYRPGGRGVLTAGHCWHAENGGVVKSTWSLGNLNSLNALKDGTHADIRWIVASDARPWVYGDSSHKARVVQQKSAGTVGGPACVFGRNDDSPRCGTISSTNAQHQSSTTGDRVYGQYTATFSATGGDSGGAVAGSTLGATARGTVSAGGPGAVNYSWIGYADTYDMGNLVTE
ncbi:hypothetical protein [Janibacter terrae]|uniref:hypothetical protein n=1 Tax=Janibacter terrae TaxID=103817 RepID=UPI00146D1268|nr:hypothetical protein [Janibacter terrae]